MIERHHIQAMGAALSRHNWHATETAYNALRDAFDLATRDAPQAQAVYQVKLIDGNWRDLKKSEVPEANDWGELVRVLYTRPSPPTEAKPVATLVETSIDTMREAANDELRRNGWHKQPNARLALHQVKELMAAFGMHVYRGEVGCDWPNCGCCADAACADALPALASLDNHKDQRS